MPVILGVLGLAAAVVFFLLRANSAVKAAKELDRDTKGLQRRLHSGVTALIGTPLARVRDPRLAATILMLQLVRTGSPITDAERAKIIELMGAPLGVDDLSGMFETAWGYTQERRPFGLVADELVPMLMEQLAEPQRRQLIGMLTEVASAYSDASELQTAAIARLAHQLRVR